MLRELGTPINGDSFRHWWVGTSVGIWWSSPTDPVWTFDLPDYIAPAWNRNRKATTFQMRAPVDIAGSTEGDNSLIVIDPVSGDYVEVWQADIDPVNRRVTNRAGTPGWATGNAITGPGAGTLGGQNDGVRAANFALSAGLITGADLAAGEIDHALAVGLTWDTLMGGGSSGYGANGDVAWMSPATAWEGGYWSGPIKMGSRLGIPAGTPEPAGLSSIGKMVFDALQTYGAFVGDYAGGPWPVISVDNRTVDQATMEPLYAFWANNGSADMEKIAPLLRVADYQP